MALDANGANTTAAAAVLSARKHSPPLDRPALVVGTGAVGQRIARLLAREGVSVLIGSRQQERADQTAARVQAQLNAGEVSTGEVPLGTVAGVDWPTPGLSPGMVFAAAAAGVQVVEAGAFAERPRVMIDLNAVPPAGIEGIDAMDAARDREGMLCYGALGVGGLKMKIHRLMISQLFERNDQVFEAEQVYDLGRSLGN